MSGLQVHLYWEIENDANTFQKANSLINLVEYEMQAPVLWLWLAV